MRRTALRSAAATVTSQGLRQAVSLAGTMIVARHVTPVDYGLVAMVMAPLVLLETLREFGLMTVCVQEPELDHDRVNTMFWINTSAGFALAIIAAVAAPALARFYDASAIVEITVVLACGLALASLSIEHYGLLRRQMRFTEIAVLEGISTSASVIIGIWAACSGWGYRAILAQILAARGINVAGAWFLCAWRPTLSWHPRGVWPLLRTGAHLTGTSLLGTIARSMDTIALARFTGPLDVGLYTRGLSIGLLPVGLVEGPLSTISVSALARLQHDPERRAHAALVFIRWLSVGMTGLALVLALIPDVIVTVILGRQWGEAVPLLRWLALMAIAVPLANAATVVATVFGQLPLLLRCTAVSAVILAGTILWGAAGGAQRLAPAYSLAALLTAAATLAAVLYKALPTGRRVLQASLSAVGAGLVCYIVAQAAGSWASSAWHPEWLGAATVRLSIGVVMYGAWACANLKLHRHVLKTLRSITEPFA
ncbi:MAG: oligosaccharide flippase family protein [Kiritimatiellia bacterium]